MKFNRYFLLFYLVLFSLQASAIVKYDEGGLVINGIQLLQDQKQANVYYYIPPYPRLSMRKDSTFEFLCIKYVGDDNSKNGGLFHALVEFSLPDETVAALNLALQKQVGQNAVVAGPVQFVQTAKDGEDGGATFKVISATLTQPDPNTPAKFTRSLVTSGYAPVTPGSKAAIASLLSPEGATLLFDSFKKGPTSDLSVSIQGAYEAYVQSYNAMITADMSVVYKHFSMEKNQQEGYDKSEIRRIVDDMSKDGSLKVEVFDRSKSLDVKNNLEGIMNIVTTKITEIMFDATNGWSKEPKREEAVTSGQVKGRQERGWFAETFMGADNTPYYTDNQFVLKDRKDITTNKFYLNLSQATTIKVPVLTSGNIAGLYEAFKQDSIYFRIVDLNDAAFERRTIYFKVDGDYADAFSELVNFATVSFKKGYKGTEHNDVVRDLVFTAKDFKDGVMIKDVSFPRLGLPKSDWINYQYRITWSFKGSDKLITLPPGTDRWLSSSDAGVSIVAPFIKHQVEVDADRAQFTEKGVASVVLKFGTYFNNSTRPGGQLVLKAGDVESMKTLRLFHDRDTPVAYQATWYYKSGKTVETQSVLNVDYLYLTPPE